MLSQRAVAATALLTVVVSIIGTGAAAADPPGSGGGSSVTVSPSPTLPGVGIGAGTSGSSGGGGNGSGANGAKGGGSTDPCTYTPAVPPPPPSTPVGNSLATGGGTVVWQTCPGIGSGGYIWIPPGKAVAAPPAAIDLARQAYGQLALPQPKPSRYPAGTLNDGRPYTIVQTHMWFSTSPHSWRPLSKKVCAGALCATATAKPTTLTFDPGNGDGSVSCPGPGMTFQKLANGSWIPGLQPQGCDYQYTKSSYGDPNGEVTSTYTISWTVTWTATNGQGGTFDDLQSAATSRFAVAELQSVVTR